MKVIFLDIDGVLNKHSDYLVRMDGTVGLPMNIELVENLLDIIKETDAEIVLSSSWRNMKDGRKIAESVIEKPFLDETVDLYDQPRGKEIQEWLDRHPSVEQYVILDDDSDMLDGQLRNFVQTEFEHGLTSTLAYRATHILNNKTRRIK